MAAHLAMKKFRELSVQDFQGPQSRVDGLLKDVNFEVFVALSAARAGGGHVGILEAINETACPAPGFVMECLVFSESSGHLKGYPNSKNHRKKKKQIEKEQPRQFGAYHGVGMR
jgi:hypothetical protein